jgi:hypothetical protein
MDPATSLHHQAAAAVALSNATALPTPPPSCHRQAATTKLPPPAAAKLPPPSCRSRRATVKLPLLSR